MQDDNIGKICNICKKRDYIPYICKKCSKQFCDEHYWQKDIHYCIEFNQKPIKQPITDTKNQKALYFCSECKCKLYTVNHHFCYECNKLFCLKHRHHDEHSKLIQSQKEPNSCQLI